jgi:hypothetical protein
VWFALTVGWLPQASRPCWHLIQTVSIEVAVNDKEFVRAVSEELEAAINPLKTFVDNSSQYPLDFLNEIFDRQIRLNLRAPESYWENAACIASAVRGDVENAALTTEHEAASAREFTATRVKAFRSQADQIVAGGLDAIRIYDESRR